LDSGGCLRLRFLSEVLRIQKITHYELLAELAEDCLCTHLSIETSSLPVFAHATTRLFGLGVC
jgi:hypothetical protein